MAKVVARLSTLLLVAVMFLFLTSIMMVSSLSSLSSRTWKYDVFLSFRGKDTRKTIVDHLYFKLEDHGIHTFKDDVTHQRGDSNDPALFIAIEESQIAIIVFSKNYADSSWCLYELVHILKCKEERGLIVIPIFYDVSPSDVSELNGQFGEAFSKVNKEANFETWRRALFTASNIAGWETTHIANGHEAAGIDIIVGTLLDKLLHVNSVVDRNVVGMGQRFKYLESKLQIGSDGVRMIGIWGVGGGGKTTLAFYFYMKNRDHFQGYCFIGNIREESAKHGLQKLQEKVLSELLKKEVTVGSVQEGRYKIQKMLCRRKVLIVLDDVDNLKQLDALAGSHDWFGGGSRIIITTRDSHLLETHMVDEECLVSFLSDDEALQLFKIHAYQENNPVEDDDEVSSRVISYANGLPLALKILASSLYGKDKNERMSFLDKLRDLPNPEVTDILKISYDGLERDEKQIFLNIACVFRRCLKENVMSILEACGFHPHIGIKVLIQKALLTISSDGFLDMHDLVQEMGLDIIRGEHSNNLKKHCRDWLSQAIEAIESLGIGKIEDIYAKNDPLSKEYIAFCSNLKILRFLEVITWHEDNYDKELYFISNEKYMSRYRYLASLLPESFQPGKLLVLHLGFTLQIKLWKGEKMPSLKEISLIYDESVVKRPDCFGLSYLQVLAQLYIRWTLHQSPGYSTSTIYVYVGHCEAYKVCHLPLSSIEEHAYFLAVRRTPNENQKSEKPQQKPNEKTEPIKCPNQKQTQTKFKIMVCLEMVQRWLLPRAKVKILVLAVMAIVSLLLAILLIFVRVISCKSVMMASSSLLASLSSRTWRKLDHLYSALQQYPTLAISNLGNLQTLIICSKKYIVLPKTILNMVNLRHLYIKSGENFIEEPKFIQVTEDNGVSNLLPSLQTLSQVSPESCQNVSTRTPNLRKHGLCGPLISSLGDLEFPNIRSLQHLEKLKLLNIISYPEATRSCNPFRFPENLKKLTLCNTGLDWDEIWTFAWLPNLEVLKLKSHACIGERWETGEEAKFKRLQVLKLHDLDITNWVSYRNNFPRLKRLVVHGCSKLKSIPLDLGSILTLEAIEVRSCSPSAHHSAIEIQKEQESEGNSFLKVHAKPDLEIQKEQ